MFCSTIIPTIGRPTLARAVCSVLDQEFNDADFEVIVVNDSGKPLPKETWQKSGRVRVINTNRRERSVGRNSGAAIATGKYLHFLDDDDILLPGALNAFWRVSLSNQNAAWLYGSYQTVDNDGNLVNEFHPGVIGNIFSLLVAGESIPFQASLLCAEDFYTAGCFDPKFSYAEDRDLGRRIAQFKDVVWTSAIVAQIRIGETGSTSDWSKRAVSDRSGREKAFQAHHSYECLRESATSSYWRGRVSRAFFASMIWNLKQRNVFIAISRLIGGITMTGLYIFSPDFWRGLGTKIR